jgi:hypothetical protein
MAVGCVNRDARTIARNGMLCFDLCNKFVDLPGSSHPPPTIVLGSDCIANQIGDGNAIRAEIAHTLLVGIGQSNGQ